MKNFTKICSKCSDEKPFSEFGNFSRSKDGKKSECKKCISLRNKKRYIEKEEELKEQIKNWQAKNKDKIQSYREKYNNKKL